MRLSYIIRNNTNQRATSPKVTYEYVQFEYWFPRYGIDPRNKFNCIYRS